MVPERMEMEHTTCIVYGFMPCTVWITCAIFFYQDSCFQLNQKFQYIKTFAISNYAKFQRVFLRWKTSAQPLIASINKQPDESAPTAPREPESI
jgi:hypothetical protein